MRRQPGHSARDEVGHRRYRGRGAVIGTEHDAAGRVVVGQLFEKGGIGAAEAEHALVRVARDGARPGTGADHPHQVSRLRVEVLRIVDEKVTNPVALGREQVRVGRERGKRRPDEFGRVERGRGRFGRFETDRAAQQHDLLVPLRESPGRDPLGAITPLAQCDEVFGTEPALAGTQHQIAQFDGESGHAERRPESLGPHGGTVVDVAAEQFAQDRVLFGAGDQSRRRVAMCCRL